MVQGLLDCGVVAAYQNGVICIGQVEEWGVEVVESWEVVDFLFQGLFHIMHDGTVDDKEEVWG